MFARVPQDERSGDFLHSEGATNRLEDNILWTRFKSGNDLALSLIYKRYVKLLFNYGMHTCYQRQLVEDTLQDLFGRLWFKREDLPEVDAVKAYLFKSFRRLLINKLSEQKKYLFKISRHNDDGFEMLSSIEDSIILQEATADQYERLKRAVESLSKRQRELIFLEFYNGLGYTDVAAVMEMSVDSVYNLMSKAIDTLRSCLKGG